MSWISVEERLPERNVEVLVYVGHPGFEDIYDVCLLDDEGAWCSPCGALAYEEGATPTHWQPLPEPPEVEK